MSSHNQPLIEGTTKDDQKVVLRPEGTLKLKNLAPQLKDRTETVAYGVILAMSSLLFIIAGYYAEHEFHWKLRAHILNELGIAGFVALFLAVTIEYVSKKRDEQRSKAEKQAIKSDVFEHVFGYRLPEGTFAELYEQILHASIIRKDFTVRYKLSALDDSPGFVKIDGQISYKLFNLTPDQKDFSFRTMIEKAPLAELDKLVKFTVVKIRVSGKDFDLLSAPVDEKLPNHMRIKKKITIKGNDYASATIRFVAVRALQGGSAFLLTPIQAMGFELFVEAWEGIEVLATPYLPQELTEGDQHLPNQNSYHWVLHRPMLPYQGVYLTWKSKPTPPPPEIPLPVYDNAAKR